MRKTNDLFGNPISIVELERKMENLLTGIVPVLVFSASCIPITPTFPSAV